MTIRSSWPPTRTRPAENDRGRRPVDPGDAKAHMRALALSRVRAPRSLATAATREPGTADRSSRSSS